MKVTNERGHKMHLKTGWNLVVSLMALRILKGQEPIHQRARNKWKLLSRMFKQRQSCLQEIGEIKGQLESLKNSCHKFLKVISSKSQPETNRRVKQNPQQMI